MKTSEKRVVISLVAILLVAVGLFIFLVSLSSRNRKEKDTFPPQVKKGETKDETPPLSARTEENTLQGKAEPAQEMPSVAPTTETKKILGGKTAPAAKPIIAASGSLTTCFDSSHWYTLDNVTVASSKNGLENVYRTKASNNALLLRIIPNWTEDFSDKKHLRKIWLQTATKEHPLGSTIVNVWQYDSGKKSGEPVTAIIPMDQLINEDYITTLSLGGVEYLPCSIPGSLQVQFLSIEAVSVKPPSSATVFDAGATGTYWSQTNEATETGRIDSFTPVIPYTPGIERAMRVCVRPTPATDEIVTKVNGHDGQLLFDQKIGGKTNSFMFDGIYPSSQNLCFVTAFPSQTNVERIGGVEVATTQSGTPGTESILRSLRFVSEVSDFEIWKDATMNNWWTYLGFALSDKEAKPALRIQAGKDASVTYNGCSPCFVPGLELVKGALVLESSPSAEGKEISVSVQDAKNNQIETHSVIISGTTTRIELKDGVLQQLIFSADEDIDIYGMWLERE